MIRTSDLRVLLVEDNEESKAATVDDILSALPGAEIAWAADAESAIALVEGSQFDLAVCDLKIPARRGDLSTQESHGLRVVAEIQAHQPGTPIVILSGHGTVEKVDPYTATADVFPVLGAPRLPMCQAAVKGALVGFRSRLEPIRVGVGALSAVDVTGGEEIDSMLERAIAQYAVGHGFSTVEVAKASGLSGSINAVVVMRSTDRPPKRVFVKVNRLDWVLDEVSRQKRFVEGFLEIANWAPTLEVVQAGLRDKGAYFSGLATDPVDLFALSDVSEENAVEAIARLDAVLLPWRMRESHTCSIGDLRRVHLPDAQVRELGMDLSEFVEIEELEVVLEHAVTHGDLHGENILVVEGLRPMLVDFAYTDVAPAILDPVTLEMSFLFHPGSPLVRDGRVLRYENWAEGNYLPDARQQSVVERCRTWAVDGRDQREFLAMSYAHALRHLKRGDTVDPDHAMAVARSAARSLS
ncbi:response regulator [Microbacterium sp. WCS2018Hpa-23]|uniref:response regulator n=1 Tax=Microbacterium sp. WCS2018Hpa-23 TaxID=3073634 RepID=UPI0028833338|nr:response regulator [Microbacterium sp. WCS2018Hpa-23]